MLPDRAARAFPLLLLGLMAGIAMMLDQLTSLPAFTPEPGRKSADLSISRFAATGFGSDGKPLYQLQAERMLHFPHDEHAEFEQARMTRSLPGEAGLRVSAAKASASTQGRDIWFAGNVLLQRDADARTPAITLRTSRLKLESASGRASSDAATELQMGTNRARSVGFDYDHHSAKLRLRSKVSIDYAPPKR